MTKKFNHILITGGAGYVGTPLTKMLLEQGYKVTILDTLRWGPQSILQFFSNPDFTFIKGDVRNEQDVTKALKEVDAVIHLAAIVGYPACRKEPELSRDVNINGTKNLVECVNKKIPIFFASTGSTYGKLIEKFCTETTPLNPLSNYAEHKVAAEDIIKTNEQFVIYRFATAFGISPRMRLDLLPNDFTYKAVKEKTLIVYEKNFMRTFIHVRDMGMAFIFALENFEKMNGEVYNVGDNKMNYSKEQICLMIKEKIDYYLHFADVGHDLDQRDYMVSYDKIHELGFHTSISMEQGIEELINVCQIINFNNPYYNA